MTAMTTELAGAVPVPAALPPRVTIRPAPHREPPFDDELTARPAGRYDQPLPLIANPRGPLEIVPADPGLADPARWSRSLLIALGEIAAGRRPLQQLGAMFSMPIATGLTGDLERCTIRGRRHWMSAATVRSVRASQTSETVAEVSATLHVGGRVRAAALHLEARDGRWRCTKLHLG